MAISHSARRYRWRKLAVAAAVLLGAPGVVSSQAQQPPAPAAVTAPVIAQGYWQETKMDSCSFTICILTFSAVPAGKQVIVTSVSCSLSLYGNGPVRSVKLGAENGAGTQQANVTALKITFNGTSGSVRYYAINDATVHILRAGEKANITFTIANSPLGEMIECSLGGLIKP
jgi:hypothetical protein